MVAAAAAAALNKTQKKLVVAEARGLPVVRWFAPGKEHRTGKAGGANGPGDGQLCASGEPPAQPQGMHSSRVVTVCQCYPSGIPSDTQQVVVIAEVGPVGTLPGRTTGAQHRPRGLRR